MEPLLDDLQKLKQECETYVALSLTNLAQIAVNVKQLALSSVHHEAYFKMNIQIYRAFYLKLQSSYGLLSFGKYF